MTRALVLALVLALGGCNAICNGFGRTDDCPTSTKAAAHAHKVHSAPKQ